MRHLPLALPNLRHFALFIGLSAAYGALADLVLQHGIVGGTGAAKLFAGEDLANVDQDERKAERHEDDPQHIYEFHKMTFSVCG